MCVYKSGYWAKGMALGMLGNILGIFEKEEKEKEEKNIK